MTDTTPKQSRPERVDKKGVMTYLPDQMAIRLKVFAAQHQTTIQKIGEAAFTEWLAKHDAASNAANDSRLVIVPATSGDTVVSATKQHLGVGKTKPIPKTYTARRSDKSSTASASSLKRKA